MSSQSTHVGFDGTTTTAIFDIVDKASHIIMPRGDVNGSAILAMKQRHHIQQLAIGTSSISIITVLVALYWFFMMRRNFRRDLILLLIVGDLWKSMWYWIFSVHTLSTGPVASGSAFCESTGFFLSQGLESCGTSVQSHHV